MTRSWLLVLAAVIAGCTTYSSAQKTPDGTVYLSGTSGFLVFTSSFIKRCTESGTTLTCEQLTIVDAASDKADEPKPKRKRKPATEDSEGDDSSDQPKKQPKKTDSDDE